MTTAREVFGTERIDLLRLPGIAFTTVNIGPGRAINDRIRTLFCNFGLDCRSVCDVECLVVVTQDLVAVGRTVCDERAADQPTRSCYEDLQSALTSVPYCV